jgi:hypothetical protein
MSYDEQREDFYDREIEKLWRIHAPEREAPSAGRCTRNMPPEWPTEERIDNIGHNGPTGEHYMNKYQRKLTSPLMVWDRNLAETETEVFIDVYDVLNAFNVSNPATAHAIKKLLCTGSRGLKDWETDLQEAIDSLERAKSFPPLPF